MDAAIVDTHGAERAEIVRASSTLELTVDADAFVAEVALDHH